eukprot:jgi/Mesvir1/7039/Mv09159-RA.4
MSASRRLTRLLPRVAASSAEHGLPGGRVTHWRLPASVVPTTTPMPQHRGDNAGALTRNGWHCTPCHGHAGAACRLLVGSGPIRHMSLLREIWALLKGSTEEDAAAKTVDSEPRGDPTSDGPLPLLQTPKTAPDTAVGTKSPRDPEPPHIRHIQSDEGEEPEWFLKSPPKEYLPRHNTYCTSWEADDDGAAAAAAAAENSPLRDGWPRDGSVSLPTGRTGVQTETVPSRVADGKHQRKIQLRNVEAAAKATPSFAGGTFTPATPADSEEAAAAFVSTSTRIASLDCLTLEQQSNLRKAGFATVRDILHHFPKYAGCLELVAPRVGDTAEDPRVSFVGRVVSVTSKRDPRAERGGDAYILEWQAAPDPAQPGDDMSDDEREIYKNVHGRKKRSKREGMYAPAAAIVRSVPDVILTSFAFRGPHVDKVVKRFPEGSRVRAVGKLNGWDRQSRLKLTKFEIGLLPRIEDEEHVRVGEQPGADGNTLGMASTEPATSLGGASGVKSASSGGREATAELHPSKLFLVARHPPLAGLSPACIRNVLESVLQQLPDSIDRMPPYLLQKYDLDTLPKAFVGIHFPSNVAVRDRARKRLVFDHFFYMQLWQLMGRRKVDTSSTAPTGCPSSHELANLLIRRLPFALTGAQLRVLQEIRSDLDKNVPMRRLLQGDVGSGKTVVALLALLHVVEKGLQGAIMAPTAILAEQHVACMRELLERLPPGCLDPQGGLARDGGGVSVRIELLTGSTRKKVRQEIVEGLADGSIHIVVGTTALQEPGVKFARLGLAVIDEQQKFGVHQRLNFLQKAAAGKSREAAQPPLSTADGSTLKANAVVPPDGQSPTQPPAPISLLAHELAMSATPIPRTAALTLFGQMDYSIIDELPPGRIPVETRVIQDSEESRASMYQDVRKELEKGGRAFIVFPRVKESNHLKNGSTVRAAEPEHESLRTQDLEGFACGLVHGKMSQPEKAAAMEDFRTGRTQVLVATTVIQVGVDVPDASVIVVEHAERFGMADLHQMRGRVGRGDQPSKCYLLSSARKEVRRLKVLETVHDGFEVANHDLEHRGPGDLVGTKQSGHDLHVDFSRYDHQSKIVRSTVKCGPGAYCVYYDSTLYKTH